MTLDPERRPTVLDCDPKRNGPEPWFVGSGKGLMIGVLLVCAILIVVRGVSTWWFVEAAWHRWLPQLKAAIAEPVPIPAAPMPVVRAAPAERSLPTGGHAASAVRDEAESITNDDYPVDSIRGDEQGTTTIRWVIGIDGRVSDCGTVESSGFVRLDAAACAAIMRSARYSPARTVKGERVATTRTRRVKWVLPTS